MSNVGGESSAAGYGFGAGVSVNLPGLSSAAGQIDSLNSSLRGLNDSLSSLSQKSSSLTSSMTTMLSSIEQAAAKTTAALAGMTSTMGSGSGGGTATSFGNPSSYLPSSSGRSSGMSFSSALGTDGTFLNSLAMFPLRFMQDRINTNREFALSGSVALGGQGFATGANTQDYMSYMGKFPGSVLGSGADVLTMMQAAQQYGGMLSPNGLPQGPRASGLLAGMSQAQMMNPGASVASIAGTIGGFASNTGAQQQAQMLTGGAFGMIKAGGGQKSLQEWAESVLRWLEGLRGGSDRGKPFDYGQLMAQYFPGSNIDAWFNANGVPQGMKDYWWEYALGKTKSGGTTQGNFTITPQQDNLAQQRLMSQSTLTSSEFNLAGSLGGTYSNREQSNQWFNQLMGSMMQKMLPQQVSSGMLQFAQYLPDSVEDLIMSLLNKSGTFGAAVGGAMGYGPGLFNTLKTQFGDVGDIGDWGPNGGTSTAGLSLDMRKRVNAMMRANPNLQVNSGLRDLDTQQKLFRKGGNRVSGKASAHTSGRAVDLGPRSQYGWLVNNAHKFGLASGIGHGEPWHVGMPGDIGDPTGGVGSGGGGGSSGSVGGNTTMESIMKALSAMGVGGDSVIADMFGPMLSMLSGQGSSSDMASLMGSAVPMMFSKLFGFFGGGGTTNPDALAFQPDFYNQLVSASKDTLSKISFGGIAAGSGGGSGTSGLEAALMPGLVGLPWLVNTIGGLGGSSSLGGSVSPGLGGGAAGFSGPMGSLARAKAAAQVAFNAGFRGQDLWEIVSIGGRESGGWNPNAINPTTSDRGLFQINWSANKKALMGAGIAQSDTDLLDPGRNAMAAYQAFQGAGGQWWPWALGSNGSWDRNGDPLARTQQYQSTATQAIQELGIGDVGDYGGGGVGYNRTTVHNWAPNINVNVNGGAQGIDLRRTATTIADHLTDEMNKRMVRSS